MGDYSLTQIDNTGESTVSRVNVGPVNDVTLLAIPALALAYRTALANIVGGTFTSERLVAYSNRLAGARPTDVNVQREKAWVVVYEDTTTHEQYKNIYGCADTGLIADGKDEIDYANLAVTAFIAAFEALVKSPTGGSSNVLHIYFVGRAT